jgi:hypothetical protein
MDHVQFHLDTGGFLSLSHLLAGRSNLNVLERLVPL